MKTTTKEEVTEAIILRQMPYQETGALVSAYTREFGKITLRARGVKKLTSKNAAGVQALTRSELTLMPRSGISTLIRAQALAHYPHIKAQIACEIVADYLLEYCYRYEEDNQPDEACFQMLKETLEALETGYAYQLIYCMILVFIMERNGVTLMVDGCVHCGSPAVAGFSLGEGGFVCREHMGARDLQMPKETLKLLRHIYKRPMRDVGQITFDMADIKRIIPIFEYFCEDVCGITLKTKSFLKQIV